MTELTPVDVARAHRDLDYLNSLSAAQLEDLPANPVGDLMAPSLLDPQHSGDGVLFSESFAVSFASPLGCFFTFACTGNCCPWIEG